MRWDVLLSLNGTTCREVYVHMKPDSSEWKYFCSSEKIVAAQTLHTHGCVSHHGSQFAHITRSTDVKKTCHTQHTRHTTHYRMHPQPSLQWLVSRILSMLFFSHLVYRLAGAVFCINKRNLLTHSMCVAFMLHTTFTDACLHVCKDSLSLPSTGSFDWNFEIRCCYASCWLLASALLLTLLTPDKGRCRESGWHSILPSLLGSKGYNSFPSSLPVIYVHDSGPPCVCEFVCKWFWVGEPLVSSRNPFHRVKTSVCLCENQWVGVCTCLSFPFFSLKSHVHLFTCFFLHTNEFDSWVPQSNDVRPFATVWECV